MWEKNETRNEDSVVYRIPCSGCESSPFCQSSRGLGTKIREHRADVRTHRPLNAVVDHVDKDGHVKSAEKWPEHKKRKVTEALYIPTNKNINKRTGDTV